ncbi:MAG: nuclear transport factor 2 family protein [Gemmatimonadaceae bacterium]|jgi:hypothetical protein|nr:nuclear transport factor 2 family protein [Gemmatimonadaceae bacterium]
MMDSVYAELARGDTAAFGRRLTLDVVWTSGVSGAEFGRDQIVTAATRYARGGTRLEIDSVRVQSAGTIAFVSGRLVDRRTLGGVEFTTKWRVTDAFIWPSVDTSNPATDRHRKTGHQRRTRRLG